MQRSWRGWYSAIARFSLHEPAANEALGIIAKDTELSSCDGTLAMWGGGREIAPMRLALPGFVGLSYGLGQVESALQGYVAAGTDACSMGGWWNPHHAGLWGPGLVHRPGNYPPEGQGRGPKLRWHEIGHSFVEAVRRGDPADADPVGAGQNAEEWAGRIWRARDYWLMVCGDLAARNPEHPLKPCPYPHCLRALL